MHEPQPGQSPKPEFIAAVPKFDAPGDEPTPATPRFGYTEAQKQAFAAREAAAATPELTPEGLYAAGFRADDTVAVWRNERDGKPANLELNWKLHSLQTDGPEKGKIRVDGEDASRFLTLEQLSASQPVFEDGVAVDHWAFPDETAKGFGPWKIHYDPESPASVLIRRSVPEGDGPVARHNIQQKRYSAAALRTLLDTPKPEQDE